VLSFILLARFSGAPPNSTYIPAHIENGKFVPGVEIRRASSLFDARLCLAGDARRRNKRLVRISTTASLVPLPQIRRCGAWQHGHRGSRLTMASISLGIHFSAMKRDGNAGEQVELPAGATTPNWTLAVFRMT
jgi:hypothetical protein